MANEHNYALNDASNAKGFKIRSQMATQLDTSPKHRQTNKYLGSGKFYSVILTDSSFAYLMLLFGRIFDDWFLFNTDIFAFVYISLKTELKWYESFQNDICYSRVNAAKSNNSPEFSKLELKQVIR